MSGAPHFLSQPFRYMRYYSHAKPAIFWAVVIGMAGPVVAFAAPPIRAYFGDGPRPRVPMTYPIPPGPRKIPEGYDDP